MCFPEPSPGVLTPPCTSASSAGSSSSSRDIHLDAMLPSNARTGAPAQSQGSEGPVAAGWVITHAAVPRNPKQQNILLLGFPRSVSPGPQLPEPRGGGVTRSQPTARLLLEGDWNIPRSVVWQPGIPSATDGEGTAGFLDPHPEILILFCFSSRLV